MPGRTRLAMLAGSAVAAAAIAIPAAVASGSPGDSSASGTKIKHVLLISVDGLHQSDLDWYAANHPGSDLWKLEHLGAVYSHAQTAVPSDSDPGATAIMTGGDPKATGVYYDVEYNRGTYEAGTSKCTGPTGGDVVFDSPDDKDVTRLDAGQGIPGLQ